MGVVLKSMDTLGNVAEMEANFRLMSWSFVSDGRCLKFVSRSGEIMVVQWQSGLIGILKHRDRVRNVRRQ